MVRSRLDEAGGGGRKKRRKRSAATDEKWVENDPTVPAGWKIRVVNCSDGHAVTFFQTPNGTMLKVGLTLCFKIIIRGGTY